MSSPSPSSHARSSSTSNPANNGNAKLLNDYVRIGAISSMIPVCWTLVGSVTATRRLLRERCLRSGLSCVVYLRFWSSGRFIGTDRSGALNWATGETVAVKEITLSNIPKGELSQIMVSNAILGLRDSLCDRSSGEMKQWKLRTTWYTWRPFTSVEDRSSAEVSISVNAFNSLEGGTCWLIIINFQSEIDLLKNLNVSVAQVRSALLNRQVARKYCKIQRFRQDAGVPIHHFGVAFLAFLTSWIADSFAWQILWEWFPPCDMQTIRQVSREPSRGLHMSSFRGAGVPPRPGCHP